MASDQEAIRLLGDIRKSLDQIAKDLHWLRKREESKSAAVTGMLNQGLARYQTPTAKE